jgi:hypothetical protein
MQAGILTMTIGTLLAAALAVPTPRAATTTRYKVDHRLHQEADATVLGGGKQTMIVKITTFLSLTLTDSAGGRAIKMVVDSARGDSLPPGAPADVIEKVKGATITGFAEAKGGVKDIKSSAESVAGLGLAGLVNELVIAPKHGAKVGDTWTDTTETSNPVGGGTLSSRTVTNWKVSGTESRGGVKALKLDGAFASSIAGAQETPGGAIDIEGTATGTNSVFVAPDGRHLGGTTSSTSNLNATLAAQGATLPIVLTSTSNITVLP